MPITSEQAQAELRRRTASAELERREQPTTRFAGGGGGEFGGVGVTGTWEPPRTLREKIAHTTLIDVLAHVPFSPWHEYKKTGAFMAKRQLRTKDYGPRIRYGMTPMGGYTAMRLPTTRKQLKNIIAEQEIESQREETIPAAIAGGVADLPGYMGEFAALGGGIPTTITRGLMGAAKMTAGQPHRMASAVMDQIERGEKGVTAVAKGWGDVYIENLSEMAGAGFPAIIRKMPFGGRIIDGLHEFHKKVGMSDSVFWKKISTKAGYNGLLNEWGEERLGTYLRGLTNVQDFGAGKDASTDERIAAGFAQDFQARNMLIEAGVLLAPLAAKQISKVAFGKREAEVEPEVSGATINIYRGVDTGKIYPDEAALKMERVEGDTRLVDKESGEEVVLDPQASQSAIASETAEEPVTSEQAIGQQYGLSNEQVTEQLSQAEQRYRELKRKDTVDRTAQEKRELAFLRRNKSNIEALLEQETQPEAPKIRRRSKTTLRAVGHKVAREADLTDEDYRELAEIVTGKRSMKDMSRKEMDEFVSALEESYGSPKELTKEDYEIPISVAGRGTTMGAVYRDAVETTDRLPSKQEIPDTVKMGFGKVSAVQRLKSFFFGIDNTPVYHLARILDGAEEGIFSEVLDKGIESGRKTTAAHSRSVHTELRTTLEEAEVTDDDLAKMSRTLNPRTQTHQMLRQGAATEILTEKINDRDFEITWANLIDIYLISNQKDGMRHLTKGGLVINNVETGKLSEAQVLDLRQKVEDNPQAVTIADAILKIGRDVWRPSLNQVSNNLEGRDIATIQDWWGLEVYMPKRVAGKQRPGLARALDINLIENKSILRDRTRSTAPLVVRDAFNRFSIFENAIAEYVGMAEPTRTSRTLLSDPVIAKALERKGYGRIRNHILDIHKHAQSVPASEGSFTAFFARHLPGLYRAVLFFNPRVIASQYTSAFNYGAYVSPEFIDSIKDGLSIENAQETLELSDIAWERFNMGHSSLELGEMAKSDASLRFWTGKASDINKLGWALKVADLGALTAGTSIAKQEYQAAQKGKLKGLSAEWWLEKDDLPDVDEAMVQRVKEEGENAVPEERQAVEVWKQLVSQRAEYLWQRTQPSWDKWNRSLLTTQKGVRRLFLLFRSFHEKSLTIFNEAKLDYENSPKAIDDKTRFVQRTGSVMVGYTVNMALRLAILAAMTRRVKEPIKYLEDFLTGWMAMFPIFGRVLDQASRRFIDAMAGEKPTYRGEPLESFPVKMINMVLKAPADLTAAAGYYVAGETEKAQSSLEKGVRKLFEGVGALYGIPVYEVKRVLPGEKKVPARHIQQPLRRRPK